MKTIAYAAALVALTATAAHAQQQGTFEVMSTSSTQTLGGVTTNVQTNYVSTTTLVPTMAKDAAIGDAPATPAETADHMVSVKLPSGETVQIADSDAAPWNKDPKLSGYDRFTFDPESGAFVATKGDDKYAAKWDENGNPVAKKAPAPAKKAVVKKAKAKKAAAPVADAAPASDTPAAAETTAPATDTATPAMDVSGTEGQ